MKILGKVLYNNQPYYKVETFDGMCDYLTVRGLYDPVVFQELKDAGYKYYDYSGKIQNEDGIDIDALEVLDDVLTEDVLLISSAYEDTALTEAEAAEGFSLVLEDIVYMDKKVPYTVGNGRYICHTMDELRAYLSNPVAPYLPINYLLNPECLVDIDDLQYEMQKESRDLVSIMSLIENKKKFSSLKQLRQLKEFLYRESVTPAVDCTEEEFIIGLNAWGPDLVDVDFTSMRVIKDYQAVLDLAGTSIQGSKSKDIRSAFIDVNGDIFFDGKVLKFDDYQFTVEGNDTSSLPFFPLEPQAIIESIDKGEVPYKIEGSKFGVVKVAVSSSRPVVVYETTTQKGGRYRYLCDINESIIGTPRIELNEEDKAVIIGINRICRNESITLEVLGQRIPMDDATSKDRFLKRFYIMQTAKELLANKVVKTKYSSFYEVLRDGAGMSPVGVLKYLCDQLSRNKGKNEDHEEFSEHYSPQVDYADAVDTYRTAIENIDSLNQIIDVTKLDVDEQKMIESAELTTHELVGLIQEATLMGSDDEDEVIYKKDATGMEVANDIFDEISRNKELIATGKYVPRLSNNFYGTISFVDSVLQGSSSFGFYADGAIADSSVNVMNIYYNIKTLITMLNDSGDENTIDNLDILQLIDALSTLKENTLIPLDSIIPVQGNKARGAVLDILRAKGVKAQCCKKHVFITDIIEELSNEPLVIKRRHYGFRGYMIDITSPNDYVYQFMSVIANTITKQLHDTYRYSEYDNVFKNIGWSIAPSIVFSLILNNGDDFKANKIGDSLNLELDNVMPMLFNKVDSICIPVKASLSDLRVLLAQSINDRVTDISQLNKYSKFMTLYDFTIEEYNAKNQPVINVINASVDPWYVYPTKNSEIPVHNFYMSSLTNAQINNYTKAEKESVRTVFNAYVQSLPDIRNRFCLRDIEELDTSNPASGLMKTFMQNEDSAMGTFISIMAEITRNKATLKVGGTLDKYALTELDSGAFTEAVESKFRYESIDMYRERFAYYESKAKKQGKVLVRIPLKSDIHYNAFAPYSKRDIDVCLEPEYSTDIQGLPKISISKVRSINTKQLLLEGSQSGVADTGVDFFKQFDCNEFAIHDLIAWDDLILGEYNYRQRAVVKGNSLVVFTKEDGKVTYLQDTLQRDNNTLNKLVDLGIIYQLNANTYLVSAVNGMYSFESVL